MPTYLEAMEEAYHELKEQHAGYRPRIDFYVPQEPHYYRWSIMEGAPRKSFLVSAEGWASSPFA